MSATLTPYEACKATNAALAEAVPTHRPLPPQMFYNYTTARIRAGKNPLIPCTEVKGQTVIKSEDFAQWLDRYIRKQVALAAL